MRDEWLKIETTWNADFYCYKFKHRGRGLKGLCTLIGYLYVDDAINLGERVRINILLSEFATSEGIRTIGYWFARVDYSPEEAYKERLDFLNRIIDEL